ncbi:MAG TPA: DUF4384 domain-containing protein [Polyangiaceae bacterium]|nr:DUF4384 domain-containing protein [Polyangiaceae bacterium]
MMESPRRASDCASDLTFDRLVGGELVGHGERKVLDHVETCASCRARLAEIRSQQDVFAQRKLDLPPRRRSWRRAIGFGIGPALAAACWLLLQRPRDVSSVDQGEERTKGGSPLAFYVLRDGEVSLGRAESALHPGDAIEFVFSAERPGYLAIFSVDGGGKASVYFPLAPRAAAFPVGPARPVPLSTVLDATLGEERIYAFHCESAVELEPIRAALAREAGAPPAAPGCRVSTLRVRKERP